MSEPSSVPSLDVVRNDASSRYEGRIGGELATVIDYDDRDSAVVAFTHTGTEPHWQGRGLAGETTRLALADVRARGLRVQPDCPFTAHYLDTHPDLADLRA